MRPGRFLRHLFAPTFATRRRFPRPALEAIEAAIAAAECRTSAEIRFAIETSLDIPDLWRDKSPRERAAEAFAQLRVWDSELRNGVLIYVLLADHDVEIVADRAAAACISADEWEQACRLIEEHFRAGQFREGAVAGVSAVGALLASHFPVGEHAREAQPNQPALL
jgi:uncharacterized membrane protein